MIAILFEPFKVFFLGADFEMAFGDAEVDGRVAVEQGKTGAGFHFVAVMKDEKKLLLVDGCGCQQGGFHATVEPVGEGKSFFC